ncbi:MAG: hypothetical protein ACOC55_06170 [Candidatus Natronoplasma sp.]
MKEAIKEVEDGWERDLDTLLPSIPDYGIISAQLIESFEYL